VNVRKVLDFLSGQFLLDAVAPDLQVRPCVCV